MADLVNKRVRIFGTSREDLNTKEGTAQSFDADQGRVTVTISMQ